MKLWILSTFYAVSLLILSGCTAKPTPNNESKVDSTLPIVELTQNGTVVDMNAIAFEWKSITDPRVKGVYIYKLFNNSIGVEDDYYDTVDGRYTTHYLDTKIKPSTEYKYYFKTFSENSESLKSAVKTVSSLAILKSVSWIHSIQNMPRSAKIIWRPHPNEKVKAYVLERKTLEKDEWEKLSTIKGRLSAEYIDKELEDNRVYKYRIKVLTYDKILSAPSAVVKVVTKPLPQSVSNIQASRNLPKEIKLTWDKSNNKDFSRYYVYKSQEIDNDFELIAKLHNNHFTDKIGEDGKQYFYRISVVDTDGLESKHKFSSIQGITLVRPTSPVISEVKLLNNKVLLTWNNVDSRVVRYIVSKRYKKGWFDEIIQDYKISGTKFIDKSIEANTTYKYKVIGIDKNGIESLPSMEAEVKTPKVAVISTTVSTPNEVQDATVDIPVTEVEEIIPTQDFN